MVFDYKPQYTITGDMLDLVSQIMETLGHISSVGGDLSRQPNLRKINRMKSIHSSAAIEGNTLTLEQVTAVINGKTVLAPPNEIQEIKQAYKAYELLETIDPTSIKDMLKVHGVMMRLLDDEAGKFRSSNVGVYASYAGAKDKTAVHIAPPPANVPPLVYKLFDWLKNENVHDLIKSSIFHYEFEFIHPFNDGNGRMGRFMQSALLAMWKPIFAWIPIESVIKERQQEYYDAFRQVQNDGGRCNAFILYMLNAILVAVRNIQADSQKFIKSQTAQIQRLLEILDHNPISAKEIALRLGLKSTGGVKKNYLDPAIRLGLAAMNLPDKPTSKHQKYYRVH